jgi:gas vesicle protein
MQAIRNPRTLVLVGLLAGGSLLGGACAKTYSAESDGKDVGQAVCDVRDADSADEAADALADLESQIDDLTDDVSTFTSEDRADISENLSDLAEHVADGDENLAQQDITVIQRSLSNIRDDLGQTGQAALDGIREGLMECEGG